MRLKEIEKTLDKFAQVVIQQAKTNLQNKKYKSSGRLAKSLKYQLTQQEKGLILSFFGTDYADFLDKGVKGAINDKSGAIKNKEGNFYAYTDSMPPPNKLDKWIVRNNFAPRQNGRFTGRKISTVGFKKSIQFLLARSIFSRGIKASMYFTKPFEKEYKTLAANLVNDFKIEIDNKIENK